MHDERAGPPGRRALLTGAGAALGAGCVSGWVSAPPAGRTRPRPAPEVRALIVQMTLDEKVGQMTQADVHAVRVRPADIADLGLGSLLNGGNSLPRDNSPAGWAEQYDRVQGVALGSRLGVPLLFGTDAVHGHGAVRGATVFPHNLGLGATDDADLVEACARATAVEVAGTGIDWTFAPCVAVVQDVRWGRSYESFGSDPARVARLGAAAVRGFQGVRAGATGPIAPDRVLACAKHFVGDGGTTGGVDQGDTRVDEATLRALHLPPYRAVIEAGVGSIMISYSSWDGRPMHAHDYLIREVLKGELGFQGFVVSDWEAVEKMGTRLGLDYPEALATAIDAGIDMVMAPTGYRRCAATLAALVRAGRLREARIDDAVARILRQKLALGLWERPLTDRALTARVGCAEHRALARRAVARSLVALRARDGALPLPGAGTLAVIGPRADDLGVQCGGWTVGWQGRRGRTTTGTTVLEALRTLAPAGLRVHASPDGEDAATASADTLLVVLGENPYAEYSGDRRDLALPAADRGLWQRVRARRAPRQRLVVLLLAGRPLDIPDLLAEADAVVMAWLPGSEGAGVADVLLGRAAATGSLPVPWPGLS